MNRKGSLQWRLILWKSLYWRGTLLNEKTVVAVKTRYTLNSNRFQCSSLSSIVNMLVDCIDIPSTLTSKYGSNAYPSGTLLSFILRSVHKHAQTKRALLLLSYRWNFICWSVSNYTVKGFSVTLIRKMNGISRIHEIDRLI
jgi:hypothetical protein